MIWLIDSIRFDCLRFDDSDYLINSRCYWHLPILLDEINYWSSLESIQWFYRIFFFKFNLCFYCFFTCSSFTFDLGWHFKYVISWNGFLENTFSLSRRDNWLRQTVLSNAWTKAICHTVLPSIHARLKTVRTNFDNNIHCLRTVTH